MRNLNKIVAKTKNNSIIMKTLMKIKRINNPRKVRKRIIIGKIKKYRNLIGKVKLGRKKRKNKNRWNNPN